MLRECHALKKSRTSAEAPIRPDTFLPTCGVGVSAMGHGRGRHNDQTYDRRGAVFLYGRFDCGHCGRRSSVHQLLRARRAADEIRERCSRCAARACPRRHTEKSPTSVLTNSGRCVSKEKEANYARPEKRETSFGYSVRIQKGSAGCYYGGG